MAQSLIALSSFLNPKNYKSQFCVRLAWQWPWPNGSTVRPKIQMDPGNLSMLKGLPGCWYKN
jgi:hypothetical protein